MKFKETYFLWIGLVKFRGGLTLREYFILLEGILNFLTEIQLDNVSHLSVLGYIINIMQPTVTAV